MIVMHEDIKRYTRSNVLIRDNADFPRLKEVLIKDLENEMRIDGVLVCLDIDPHWTVEYNAEKNLFECTLSLYGIFVGEENFPDDQAFWHGRKIKIR